MRPSTSRWSASATRRSSTSTTRRPMAPPTSAFSPSSSATSRASSAATLRSSRRTWVVRAQTAQASAQNLHPQDYPVNSIAQRFHRGGGIMVEGALKGLFGGGDDDNQRKQAQDFISR